MFCFFISFLKQYLHEPKCKHNSSKKRSAPCGFRAIASAGLGWEREVAKNSDVISTRKGVGNIACARAVALARRLLTR